MIATKPKKNPQGSNEWQNLATNKVLESYGLGQGRRSDHAFEWSGGLRKQSPEKRSAPLLQSGTARIAQTWCGQTWQRDQYGTKLGIVIGQAKE